MEDVNRETISSNISLENVTQETSLTDLTHGEQNDNCEMADYDTSTSRTVAQNPTISKSVIKFLKDIRGLIKCPLTLEVMRDPFMGTDHTSYEKDCISH